MTLWMIRGGRQDIFLPACREYGVAILGFQPLGNLSGVKSKEEVRERISTAYQDQGRNKATITKWAGEIWSFLGEIETGDDIVMPYHSGSRLLLGRWQGGPYQYRKDLSDHGFHVRAVEWISDIGRDQISATLLDRLLERCTVKRLADNDAQLIGVAGRMDEPEQISIEPLDDVSEGERWQRERAVLARSAAIVDRAWAANVTANAGMGRCEICSFQSSDRGMFDIHHLIPIALGVRKTRMDDLAVLCPRCHRQAHRKPGMVPFTLDELRALPIFHP